MIEYLKAARGDAAADIVLKNGLVLNVFTDEIIRGDVAICGDTIIGVGSYNGKKEIDCTGFYLVPGLIDAHMHIESTMVTPLELSKILVQNGTTTIIADPHEIVNVKGRQAMDYMLECTRELPINVYFTLPSSVPVTEEETNGAGEFTAEDMEPYLSHNRILGLGEVMRYNDVIGGDKKMLEKLSICQGKVLDGHAPGIGGYELQAYRLSGIENDHECSTIEEALDKLRAGLRIYIREGSGAKNLETIVKGFLERGIPLEQCMFCTDDKHLADIMEEGHINDCVRKAIALSVPAAAAYKMAGLYTARAYGLKHLGAVAAGYQADILVVKDLNEVKPHIVIQSGNVIEQDYLDSFSFKGSDESLCSTVKIPAITAGMLKLPAGTKNHVIEMLNHQLTTKHLFEAVPSFEGYFMPNREYNKLCVIERHGKTGKIGTAPLKGFRIQHGAIATSVAHDSHNIIAAGDNDEDIIAAVNCIRDMQGGIAIASGGNIIGKLALPVAGLMSRKNAHEVRTETEQMLGQCRVLGINEEIDPFITLSFMALTVIPEIRLTERGLYYDGNVHRVEEIGP